MFWVRIRLGGREYLGVLDTGATISIVAKKTLPCGSLKNTMTTAAIRMGDGHVVHSCGDCEVEVPMGSRTIAHRFYVMDTEAFDFVLGTDFFVQHSQIQSLTLQAPYLLYLDHGSDKESVPLEQSEHTSSYPARRTSCLVAESSGFTGLGAPSLPGFPISPLPGQCINSQPWLRAPTHRVAPLMRGRPGRRRRRARATGLSPVGPPWAGAEAA